MKKGQKQLKKVTHILDEERGMYLPVIDKTHRFQKMSKPSTAKAFKGKRIVKKNLLLEEFRNPESKLFRPPVPGGVGYGVFYKQEIQWAFSNFTCLDFCIIVPERVGGDSAHLLYLTATNGSAFGVEALIYYQGQQAPFFKIFDWAKPENDQWVRSVECRRIPENFSTVDINGSVHKFCRVLNKTEQISNGVWENKVCLFNFDGDHWDNVYEYQYNATLAGQKQVKAGSWGPIVETFQDSFHENINPVGFMNSRLYNDRVNTLLGPGNSRIRNDNDGLDITFHSGHHTFLVV